MFSEKKSLIVVYKDEVLLNFLRKLIETNDDNDNEIVGTKDGSVSVIAWTEKVFADQKKAGVIQNPTLFIGYLKSVNNLIPVLDIKFDKFGVKYGWAGRQAVVFAKTSALKDKTEYVNFLTEFNDLPVPQNFKKQIVERKPEKALSEAEAKEKQFDPLAAIATFALGAIAPVTAAINMGATMVADVFDNKKLLEQQMLLYGLLNIYNNDLERFIKS